MRGHHRILNQLPKDIKFHLMLFCMRDLAIVSYELFQLWLNIQYLKNNKENSETISNRGIALLRATKFNQASGVKKLLAERADVNQESKTGGTLLHVAAEFNSKEALKEILANGAKINAADNWGRTALFLASGRGFTDITRMLLDHRAEVSIGATEIHNARPIHCAAENGRAGVVKQLVDAKANIEASLSYRQHDWYWRLQTIVGERPLHLAARNNHLPTTKLLIDAKADVNAPGYGKTPLKERLSQQHRFREDDLGVIALLLNAGAIVKINNDDELVIFSKIFRLLTPVIQKQMILIEIDYHLSTFRNQYYPTAEEAEFRDKKIQVLQKLKEAFQQGKNQNELAKLVSEDSLWSEAPFLALYEKINALSPAEPRCLPAWCVIV